MHLGGPRLLLVEDETELAGMLRDLFADEGYAVDVAANGQTGLHYGLTRTYDVVVLDRRLPVVEGLELVRTWRRRGVTTPILVLSALGNPAERVEGLDAGAEDYLAKPFDVDELLARLRALQRRHLDRARALPVRGGLHGLGLALVAEIAAAHRGDVDVGAPPGTTLRITLPAAPRRPSPASHASRGHRLAAAHRHHAGDDEHPAEQLDRGRGLAEQQPREDQRGEHLGQRDERREPGAEPAGGGDPAAVGQRRGDHAEHGTGIHHGTVNPS